MKSLWFYGPELAKNQWKITTPHFSCVLSEVSGTIWATVKLVMRVERKSLLKCKVCYKALRSTKTHYLKLLSLHFNTIIIVSKSLILQIPRNIAKFFIMRYFHLKRKNIKQDTYMLEGEAVSKVEYYLKFLKCCKILKIYWEIYCHKLKLHFLII